MGQLISQHVNKEQSRDAIQSIFPPQAYGYAGKENPPMVEGTRKGGQTSTKNSNAKPNLHPFKANNERHQQTSSVQTTTVKNRRSGDMNQQASSHGKPQPATTAKNTKREEQPPMEVDKLLDKYAGNYRNYGNKEALQQRVMGGQAAMDLKSEMAQAMKDIQMINKELSDIQKKKGSMGGQLPFRPTTKQEQSEKKLIKDDTNGMDDEYNQDFIPDESQDNDPAQDAIDILNDPFGMGNDVKEQLLSAAKKKMEEEQDEEEDDENMDFYDEPVY